MGCFSSKDEYPRSNYRSSYNSKRQYQYEDAPVKKQQKIERQKTEKSKQEKRQELGGGWESLDLVLRENHNGYGALYIGDIGAARNEDLLKQYNITAILSVAKTDLKYDQKSNIKNHLMIEAYDEITFKLTPYFEQAFQFINENRKYRNVLVHCLAGVSRSATIVIAYLMKRRKLSLKDAYKKLKRKRDEINPNTGFQNELILYEKQLNQNNNFDDNSSVCTTKTTKTTKNIQKQTLN